MKRSVRLISPAFKINMGGILLDQALPLRGIEQIDPFLLIHHWSHQYPGSQHQSELGVGPHPHRGFAPVTFIFKGGVHHRDSLGTSEVVYEGGTQWMNSGSGLIHSERPTKEIAENGGDFELVQFWINAPASRKMDPPKYQPLTKEQTPKVLKSNSLVESFLVAGAYNDIEGPIATYSEMLVMRMNFEANGVQIYTVPKDFNTLLYQLDGVISVNGSEPVHGKNLIWFENDSEDIEITGLEDSRVMLLAGKPINEKIATYGPFVLNTEEELNQAILDFQAGKMGSLKEDFSV